jgi:hypothetical protein
LTDQFTAIRQARGAALNFQGPPVFEFRSLLKIIQFMTQQIILPYPFDRRQRRQYHREKAE